MYRRRNIRGKKGSLIVETVIFLPIFILSILTLTGLIRAVYLQVSVFEAFSDEARKASVESYVFGSILPADVSAGAPDDLTGLFVDAADRAVFQQKFRSALKERGLEAEEGELKIYDRNLSVAGLSGLTRAGTVYHMRISLPAGFVDEIEIENALFFRVWDGEDCSGEVFPFSRMSESEEGGIVCIFPNAGEKYHSRDCRYVNAYAKKEVLAEWILAEYEACPLCEAEEAEYGDTVYLFRYGNSYHRSDCTSVKRYVIEMSRDDAQAKGYSACSVCGGEGR